jgi:hypothetical protein
MSLPEDPCVIHTYPCPRPVRYYILLNWPVRALETTMVDSDTIYNTPATPTLVVVTLDSSVGS